MDAIQPPLTPGTGSPPPLLAGRHAVRSAVEVCLARLQAGKQAKSLIMVGLRGVGKTVLLDQMLKDAEEKGFHTVRIEAPENRSLPALLAPQIRLAQLRLSRIEIAKDLAIRGLRALAGFASKMKVTFNDIEVVMDFDPEPGLADNGDLEGDLTTLLEQVGLAARQAKTVLVIFIDELQYVKEEQLAALIAALHRCSQKQLPVTVVGAGLPQLIGRMGEAKSYAERLFNFPFIGALDEKDARDAIEKPIQHEGAAIDQDAVNTIVTRTQGYPYFLQEWGKHT